jgi:AraC-like DNA-binding protein
MIWASLFLISIAQSIFLISLIAVRGTKNSLASRLITTLLVLMAFTNLGYVVIRTELVRYVPQLFGIPFGMMFLFGPLLYFYSQSVIDNAFRWKKKYWLHFIPYFIQVLVNLPMLLMDQRLWINFINTFLSGNLPIGIVEKVMFAIQDLQLFVYLYLTVRWIRNAKRNYGNAQYIISLSSRMHWLTQLTYCFTFFLFSVLAFYISIAVSGYYNPITNYLYTLITSCIIYFIAYTLVLNPELISPDFTKKYQAYMQFIGEDGDRYLQKIKSLMQEAKIFTNPDLKISLLADQIGLPQHQVSKLINEKFGKTFNDFVNEHRVAEFIKRINNGAHETHTLYGIAQDVGFNSKSSFNAAFKKITGKTPTNYKPSV